jgi:hypothetical protein
VRDEIRRITLVVGPTDPEEAALRFLDRLSRDVDDMLANDKADGVDRPEFWRKVRDKLDTISEAVIEGANLKGDRIVSVGSVGVDSLTPARVVEVDQDEADNPTYNVRLTVGDHEVEVYVTYFKVEASGAKLAVVKSTPSYVRVTWRSALTTKEQDHAACCAVWARILQRGVGK